MSFGPSRLGKPSAEQERRWALIRESGCICCRLLNDVFCFAEIHHQTIGGKHGAPRLGHDFTIGLCGWHHRGDHRFTLLGDDAMASLRGPSLAKTPRDFRRQFGTDDELLRAQNQRIGWTKEPQRERMRRNGSPTARPSKSFRPATEAQTLGGNATHSQDGTLPQRKRRGSKRGTHCVRPDKVIPRTRLV